MPIEGGDPADKLAHMEQRMRDMRPALELIPAVQAALARQEEALANIKEDVVSGAQQLKALQDKLEAERKEKAEDEKRQREKHEEERRAERKFYAMFSVAAVSTIAAVVSVIVAVLT